MAIGTLGSPYSLSDRGKHRKLSCPIPFDKSSKRCCVPYCIGQMCLKLGFHLVCQSL